MDYLEYNNQKTTKINAYNNNNIIFTSKQNYSKQNAYTQYLIPESKNNIKTSFVQNNQFFHEISHKNNDFQIKENPKMIKFLTEYYSYPFKNLNSKNQNKNKNSNFKNNNNQKQKEYSLNQNPNSKYINYSPQKRYTFNYKEKNEFNNPNRIQPNATQINIYNNNINNNTFLLNQKNKNKINNQQEKALLLSKLNSSKSTYNFCKEDILIEYNNVPIIEQKQNKKSNINKNSIKGNFYSFKNSSLNKINAMNNFSYENNDNNSIFENKNLKNVSYINNKTNNDLGNSFFDANVSNIEEKCDFINIKYNNNDYLAKNKKWQFSRQKNYQNILDNNIYNNINSYNNTYNIRDTNENSQINNNIFDINDNNNANISKSKINEKIYKIKKANTELFHNKNEIKNNNNKLSNSNKSFYLNKNEVEKNNNSSNLKRIKNYINKSKKDIFQNKEYNNIINIGNQKIKKRISPEPNNKIYSNEYKINLDKSKTSKNSINNNIIFHEINDTKSIINKRNNNIPNNSFKYNLLTDKNINNTNFYNYKDSRNNSYMNYENNESNANNKSNLNNKINNNYPNKQNNKNICFELKNNTSRLDNSRLETQNLILLSDYTSNKGFNSNIYGYKSSKNISYIKKSNNQFSQKGQTSASNGLNILQKINNKKNNINIILENNNLKDKKDININLKTEANFKNINRNETNKSFADNKNKILNENSFSILKNTNINKNANNMPVKLYLKKKDMIKNKDIIKQYNENKENNKTNNTNIKYKTKQINNIFNTKMNININNNINTKTQNDNIININNINSDTNILNVKKNSINICREQKDNLDLINQTKNINNSNYYNKGMSQYSKINEKVNAQTMKNELSEKNKNFKNIKFITSAINRNINNSKANLMNLPSYIQMSVNDIKDHNDRDKDKKMDDNTKSQKNILYKGNISEANRNIKNMILNNSSQYLFNYKNLETDSDYVNSRKPKINSNFFRDFVISAKNNLNNNYEIKNSFDKNLRNARNSNFSKDNITLYKPIKSPTLEHNINLINFKEKIKIPLTPNLTQVHSKKSKVIKNNSGIYVKPFAISSKSKSKQKKVKKTKSVLKIFKNNNSERNTNQKRYTRNQANLECYFKTSPLFFQKDDYFQSEFGSIKRGSTSLNTSHITKYENSSSKTKENEFSFENNSTIINYIREPYKKEYFFAYKIYKYYIKAPKIEQCYFCKNNIIKEEENKIFYEDNKNKMNNLRITFGINKSDKPIFIESKSDINNIENYNYNDIEESDLDIYKELQRKMKNDSDEKSDSNRLSITNKEEVIYKTIQKLKALNKNYNKNKNNNLINENDKKNIKYMNLQNGIQILDNLALKKGLLKNETNSINNLIAKEGNCKKDDKISLIANKLNDIFNSRKGKEINEKENINEKNKNKKNKEKNKYSKSVNKDIIKGISKIQNVFGKNNINTVGNKSNEESKLDTLENDFGYNDEQKQKIRTYIPRKKNDLNITNDKIEIKKNSEDMKKNEEKINNNKYQENDLIMNNSTNKIINSISNKNEIKFNNCSTPMKYNEEMIQDVQSLSNSDEDIIKNNINKISDSSNNSNKINEKDRSHNNSNESEDFDNYLKIIKKNKSNNILKGDITFLLNIISVGNYSIVLKQLIQIILYNINKSKEKNTILNKSLKSNEDIIYNEHLFINLIFKQITKGIKYLSLYAKLCSDLNENILNDLSEQKNIKNNKERNLKLIITDEYIKFLNNLKQEEISALNQKENYDTYLFKNKVVGFINFVFELINVEILKQQFGFYIIEQLDKIFNKDDYKDIFDYSIKIIYLEGIIELCNKLGKLYNEKENQKLSQNLNNYIQKNLSILIDNKYDIPSNLKYKIMNLISKKEKQWKDTIYDINENEEKIKNIPEIKFNLQNNIILNESLTQSNKKKEQNINELNKALIEEDIINYISYFTEENNKGKINIKTEVDKSYNWKVIDELVNNKNFGLESLIKYFISICSSFNFDENKLFLCNDYIKNIIEFYANNLPKKSVESLQNEMIKTFSNIDHIVEQNNDMYKILGNLLFILIDNKLFQIKFFNHYLKLDKKAQINLAIITKYCIISSGKFTKKYLNDFKQTKLFINNEIFEKYVNESMKDLLYYIK